MKTQAEIWRERFYDFLDSHDARELYDELAETNPDQFDYVMGALPYGLVSGVFIWPDSEIGFWAHLDMAWRDEYKSYRREDDERALQGNIS